VSSVFFLVGGGGGGTPGSHMSSCHQPSVDHVTSPDQEHNTQMLSSASRGS
jgi:hypothetical protein